VTFVPPRVPPRLPDPTGALFVGDGLPSRAQRDALRVWSSPLPVARHETAERSFGWLVLGLLWIAGCGLLLWSFGAFR